eukprot:1157616-Pelagomonas_calceolata.AAC.1
MVLRLSVNNVHSNAKLAAVAVFNARLLLSTVRGVGCAASARTAMHVAMHAAMLAAIHAAMHTAMRTAMHAAPMQQCTQPVKVEPKGRYDCSYCDCALAQGQILGQNTVTVQRTIFEGEEAVVATKLTGDPNVPAGSPSFRVKAEVAMKPTGNPTAPARSPSRQINRHDIMLQHSPELLHPVCCSILIASPCDEWQQQQKKTTAFPC